MDDIAPFNLKVYTVIHPDNDRITNPDNFISSTEHHQLPKTVGFLTFFLSSKILRILNKPHF